jgi:hypothetical protein
LGRRSGFNLDEIDAALEAAGASTDVRRKVRQTLAGSRKPGRKPTDDTVLLIRLAQLVTDGQEPFAAATDVTKELPDTQRKATRQRIYKKFREKPDLWQEQGREARKTEAERREEAIQRLRELVRKQEDMEERLRRDERR